MWSLERRVEFVHFSALHVRISLVALFSLISGVVMTQELEAMKKRLAEMEAEAAALKRMQDKSAQEMGGNSQGMLL